MKNKKTIIFSITFVAILSLVVWPSITLAQGGLVPCQDNCTFKDLFVLVANIIKFLIFTVAMPLCALGITLGGIQYAMYSANPGAKEKGKTLLINACIGLAVALASYLIVDTILDTFAAEEFNLDSIQAGRIVE